MRPTHVLAKVALRLHDLTIPTVVSLQQSGLSLSARDLLVHCMLTKAALRCIVCFVNTKITPFMSDCLGN